MLEENDGTGNDMAQEQKTVKGSDVWKLVGDILSKESGEERRGVVGAFLADLGLEVDETTLAMDALGTGSPLRCRELLGNMLRERGIIIIRREGKEE